MRRWLVILLACQPEGTGNPDDDDDTPEPPDTDTDPGTTDTSWVIDTGETGVAPECPGLSGAEVCGPPTVFTVPGTGGDSSDSGGSGAGSETIRCVSITLLFNPNGLVKIDETDDECRVTTMFADWACVDPNVVDIDGVTTANWIPRDGTTGASLTSAIWPPLSEDACPVGP